MVKLIHNLHTPKKQPPIISMYDRSLRQIIFCFYVWCIKWDDQTESETFCLIEMLQLPSININQFRLQLFLWLFWDIICVSPLFYNVQILFSVNIFLQFVYDVRTGCLWYGLYHFDLLFIWIRKFLRQLFVCSENDVSPCFSDVQYPSLSTRELFWNRINDRDDCGNIYRWD